MASSSAHPPRLLILFFSFPYTAILVLGFRLSSLFELHCTRTAVPASVITIRHCRQPPAVDAAVVATCEGSCLIIGSKGGCTVVSIVSMMIRTCGNSEGSIGPGDDNPFLIGEFKTPTQPRLNPRYVASRNSVARPRLANLSIGFFFIGHACSPVSARKARLRRRDVEGKLTSSALTQLGCGTNHNSQHCPSHQYPPARHH